MDEQKEKQQWHGRISAEISDASAEQVWKEARSFSGLERWHPSLEECEIVEGEDGSVGCVRMCRNGDLWVKEMLVAFDDATMSYTYSVIDGNIGLDSFVVSFTVLPATATAVSSSSSACTVVWEFRVDPPPNTSYEEFLGFLKSSYRDMAEGLQLLARAQPVVA
eukprot:TRINITY_DN152_c0_g1_i1.p1 TRINITY_DN152_c0_g1~~TRINITY_DN152_c0_g1_i1.p1  ORF type:complete len:164 (+),score=15.28 TRINITY_DN152_c0_g1_i1:159-650(+)